MPVDADGYVTRLSQRLECSRLHLQYSVEEFVTAVRDGSATERMKHGFALLSGAVDASPTPPRATWTSSLLGLGIGNGSGSDNVDFVDRVTNAMQRVPDSPLAATAVGCVGGFVTFQVSARLWIRSMMMMRLSSFSTVAPPCAVVGLLVSSLAATSAFNMSSSAYACHRDIYTYPFLSRSQRRYLAARHVGGDHNNNGVADDGESAWTRAWSSFTSASTLSHNPSLTTRSRSYSFASLFSQDDDDDDNDDGGFLSSVFSLPPDDMRVHFLPSVDTLSILALSSLVFLGGGGRLSHLMPSDLFRPGAYAQRSAAFVTQGASYATHAEKSTLNKIGLKYGCHTCGTYRSRPLLYSWRQRSGGGSSDKHRSSTDVSETTTRRFIGDHIPPNKSIKVYNQMHNGDGGGGPLGMLKRMLHRRTAHAASGMSKSDLAAAAAKQSSTSNKTAKQKGVFHYLFNKADPPPPPVQAFYPQCIPCASKQSHACRVYKRTLVSPHWSRVFRWLPVPLVWLPCQPLYQDIARKVDRRL